MGSENAQQDKRNPSKLNGFLDYIVRIFVLLFISVVISIVIEWLGMAFSWWDLPKHYHAKNMFKTELGWVLGDFLSHNEFYKDKFIYFFENSYYYLIKQTGLEYLSQNIDFLIEYLLAAIYMVQVIIVRLLIIICAIPAFLLLNSFIVTDGLIMRELRKLGSGMESSFIYHHLKRWIKPLAGLAIILLLSSPISIHPSIFILVFTLIPGFFIWGSVSYFKKHL